MEASGLAASARTAGKAAELDVAQHRTGRDGGEPKDGLRLRIDLLGVLGGRGRSRDGRLVRLRPIATGEVGSWACVAARRHAGTPKRQGKTCARCCVPDVRVVLRHEGKLDRARTETITPAKQSNNQGEEGGFVCGSRFLFGEPSESFRS